MSRFTCGRPQPPPVSSRDQDDETRPAARSERGLLGRCRAYDTRQVQVRNPSGTVLGTLAAYSNLNAASGYSHKTFDLSAYQGQAIQVCLLGQEDPTLQTSFVVDDFALKVP